ncbi:MAG: helix-turn-helix transcriptional regulator [Candidatus Dojkabacteria bacterium]|nr:helix-turn-helix transcriptional regulator [Candidatus Dojkabacteria bacterium]
MDNVAIKSKLLSLGLSQRKLAKRLGVHYSFLNAFLNGRYKYKAEEYNHLKNRIINFIEIMEKYFPEKIEIKERIKIKSNF